MAKKKKKINIHDILTRIFFFCHVLAVSAFVFALLAAIIPPDKMWVFSFFGLIFLPLFIVNFGFTIIWILLRRKYWLISIIPLAFGFSSLLNHFNFRFVPAINGTSSSIKVMTFNARGFAVPEGEKATDFHPKIISSIVNEKPQIICFQDFVLPYKGKFSIESLYGQLHLPYSNFRNYFNYTMPAGASGLAIYSKYPIIASDWIKFEDEFIGMYADIQIKDEVARVFSIHLQSYQLYDEDKVILTKPTAYTDMNETKIKNDSKRIAYKLRWAFKRRAPEARLIADYVDKSPYPVILCGDFNDTPASYTYKTISRKLKDPFGSYGSGVAKTYNESKYPFRIDYILHSEKLKSININILKAKVSDHNMVTSDIQLPESK